MECSMEEQQGWPESVRRGFQIFAVYILWS